MKKFKLYGNFSKKAVTFVLAGALLVIPGCKRAEEDVVCVETSIEEDQLLNIKND